MLVISENVGLFSVFPGTLRGLSGDQTAPNCTKV